jgi:hypothetical protein
MMWRICTRPLLPLALGVVFLLAHGFAAFQNLQGPETMSLRMMGMGGAFTAVADDEELLSANPAGLAWARKHFQGTNGKGILTLALLNVKLGLPGRLIDLREYATSQVNSLPTLDDLQPAFDLLEKLDRVPIALLWRTPINFSYIGYKWGFSFNTTVDARFTPISGLPPSLTLYNRNAVELKIGFAPFSREIAPGLELKIGGALKLFALSHIDLRFDLGTAMHLLAASGEGISGILPIVNSNLALGVGGGLNLGALITLHKAFTIGLAVNDAPSVLARATISNIDASGQPNLEWKPQFLFPDVRLGFAYRLPNFLGRHFLANTTLAFDIDQLFNSDYTLGTMVHLGLTCDLIDFRWFGLYAAVGLNKGYGTFGAGMKLGPFRLNYAYWQDELGLYANTRPDQKHMVEFVLRW